MATNRAHSHSKREPIDVQNLIAEAILSSFVEDDEVDTRYNILRYMNNWEKEYHQCDSHMIFEMVIKYCNRLSFAQLKEKYNLLKNGDTLIMIDKIQKDKDSLFYLIFKSSEFHNISLFANGMIPVDCEILKTFIFEDEYYVLLSNHEDNGKLYFKYSVEETKEGIKEKLYPVEEKRILEFFKFLKL